MSLNFVQSAQKVNLNNSQGAYIHNPVKDGMLLEVSFEQAKPITIREMVTRKVNKSLSFCLLLTIMVTFVSYYIAMNFEANLNKLDREIVRINTENQDLQSELDKYKSFNNVDARIGELQLLQKAQKVIEVTAMNSENAVFETPKTSVEKINWTLGY